ncbi:MAG: hypothetical protein M3Z66_10815, partial [Chloroflexota bacterium]|nr:hypothetical protein [Chloroflexota bacterium]
MANLRLNVLAAFSGVLLMAAPALAGPLTYSSYSVLHDQNVTLSDPTLSINEAAGAGQFTFSGTNGSGTNGIGGMLQTWCIDITHYLQSAGSFTTGTFLSGDVGTKVNALITNGTPKLGTDPNASSALQVAIWKAEYGSDLTVTG